MARQLDCPGCHIEYGDLEAGESLEKESGDTSKFENGPRKETAMAAPIYNPFYTGRPKTTAAGSKHTSIDRQEIIRKIKSGESRPSSPEMERPVPRSTSKTKSSMSGSQTAWTNETRPLSPDLKSRNEALGQEIARPRSALHRGDFREKEKTGTDFSPVIRNETKQEESSLSNSPVAPWDPQAVPTAGRQSWFSQVSSTTPPRQSTEFPSARALAGSNVLSFVYKAPTSPLVQASRPDTPEPARQSSRSPDKSRRHTFSPQSLRGFQSALDYQIPSRTSVRQVPSLRAERTFPYQAHQPRRSLNSYTSLPQTPAAGARRPSFSESPLHHAPMVGSYEESILRGRMSTTPSRPLNFVAQIGVLGKGECKASLRCPPHVTVPFPAVFYSYGTNVKSTTNDQPSPYVGLVDLETSLPTANHNPGKRRQRLQAAVSRDDDRSDSRTREDNSTSDAQRQRRRQKQKRRSGSPKAPAGGGYRIPQQGQLQIVIKNPNKTAVKLFLVPYDLSDMEAGQKTFIRQRSYSAGPIIDMPLSSRKNYGTDRPEAALNPSDEPDAKPVLRYLVHLHICCPSKGRFFLYKSIRVVFANRVPDGKEKLRNEIQLPEPRYSTYKAGRDSNAGTLSHGTTPEQAHRRGSVQESTANHYTNSAPRPANRRLFPHSLPITEFNPDFALPMQALPPRRSPLPTLESRPASRQKSDGSVDVDLQQSPETISLISPLASSSSGRESGEISPLSQVGQLGEPFNFERDRSRERRAVVRNESLIARRLRDLAVQMQTSREGGSEI